MKKLLMILFIALLSACTQNSKKQALDQLPEDYSLNDAKNDDCVIFEDSDITYGQAFWDNFISATDEGVAASIRLAFYYTLGDPSQYSDEYYEEIKDEYPILSLKDLHYDGEKYLIESVEEGKLIVQEYKYLMKYESQPSNSGSKYTDYLYYVLVNDNTVTWDDIMYGMLSSQFGKSIDHSVVYYD